MTLIRALAMLPGMIFERWLFVVLLAFVLTSTGWAQSLERVVGGLAQPVAITHAGDGSGRLFVGRLFVTEQRGTVRVVEDGRLLDTPFLDLRALVRDGGERGLLSLAFHPDLPRQRPAVRLLHRYRRRHGGSPLPGRRRPEPGGPRLGDGGAHLATALRQSQRRPARLRPRADFSMSDSATAAPVGTRSRPGSGSTPCSARS